MTHEAQELLDRALKLPVEERAKLADRLIESLDEASGNPAEIEKAWGEEIRRRISEVREGRVKTVTWDEAMATAREAVEKVRAKKRNA